MESDALKASHGMTPGQKGVLVRSVAPLADAARVLKPGDVIMKFDGVQVASDGTVPFRHVALHTNHEVFRCMQQQAVRSLFEEGV